MAKITYITHDNQTHTVEVQNGLTVMEGAVQNDIPGIDADCGGGMACATCHVYVKDEWFDKLPSSQQLKYAKAIDESNRIIINMVWDLINPYDKQELFNGSIRQFNNWFTGLEPADIDFYMTRIMAKQRLMPAEFRTSSSDILSEEQITEVLQDIYDSIEDDLIRATSINGLLCISCTDEVRLNKAKKHMIRHGSILRDYRKKQNAKGKTIYTYIFSKP